MAGVLGIAPTKAVYRSLKRCKPAAVRVQETDSTCQRQYVIWLYAARRESARDSADEFM